MSHPVRVRPRAALVLTLASAAGLAALFWPLFVPAGSEAVARTAEAPLIFAALLPVLVAVMVAELTGGGLDTKAVAMLGVLSATNAALRPLGTGTAGVETVFFLLVLAGRVFGPGFGFLLGSTSLFASALLTAGVGPWLPFQMLTASWIGLGAGLLPRRITGRAELAMLTAYAAVSAYAYGFCMNMWFWPFSPALSYIPGAPLLHNLHRFVTFAVTTSSLGWDTGRAVTTATATAVLGKAVLGTLRRASRRAAFNCVVPVCPIRPTYVTAARVETRRPSLEARPRETRGAPGRPAPSRGPSRRS